MFFNYFFPAFGHHLNTSDHQNPVITTVNAGAGHEGVNMGYLNCRAKTGRFKHDRPTFLLLLESVFNKVHLKGTESSHRRFALRQ